MLNSSMNIMLTICLNANNFNINKQDDRLWVFKP